MKTLIGRAIHLIVHVARFSDGKRRVTGISEVTGQMGSTIQLHDVFVFEKTGVGPNGQVIGVHRMTGRSTLPQIARAYAGQQQQQQPTPTATSPSPSPPTPTPGYPGRGR
jgi:hypothetical protein